ncbi:hypothetical protein TVAG_207280 [Trichomonas vaginalis G3]|uniref:Uncharacterized protein n=1 Tax=Trichomonas vaginalis (strain ATCC PRA-98 / G3) TaxID=412133 RepID=A2G471_TRIV3|nr:hypothetical protein TVAGG3_0821660 [Trichomonas vaginalis G3]EAX88043.1 hypothetical protein TVAG_207280 [Trichomonas vaginalis G3]KAI5497939.1 hypothetical protein TVAGG3_0821660 [Trichomonas vaginalis G3]|eukprot:XP_001300973.1 hypothetical protein [Trichomonas vaginalis G3]
MKVWKLVIAILIVVIVLLALFLLSLFAKVKVEQKPFLEQKIVYRIVKGDLNTLKHEQSIYNKRARSLFGRDMKNWPTFRILFPTDKNYGVFGILVPQTFHIEEDCLQELGFVFGVLDFIPDTVNIELPMRIKSSICLSRMRCMNKIATISKTATYAEIHDWKRRRISFVIVKGDSNGLWIPQ